jgi:hypothetical protein
MTAHDKAIKATIADINYIYETASKISQSDEFFGTVLTHKRWLEMLLDSARNLAFIATADVEKWNRESVIADLELAEADHPKHSVCQI